MEEHRDVENSGIIPHLLPKYKQKISSYKVIFYDMDGKEIEIDESYMSQAYSEIDQALYEWEQETYVAD